MNGDSQFGGKPFWTWPDASTPAIAKGEEVEINGHQKYESGTLVAVGVTEKGPVAVCWVGDELKTFSLHVNGHGGEVSIRRKAPTKQTWPF